jgi:hypothetical protein
LPTHHNKSFHKKNYAEITRDTLDLITKGKTKEKHIFNRSILEYKIKCRQENKPIQVVEIEGLQNAKWYRFTGGTDYLVKDDMVEWLDRGNIPDNGSQFMITYYQRTDHRLTDDRPGSVLSILVGAISREIELLYDQMEHVYNAGFIDTASGDALDRVVALLGVKRKGPTHATGIVSFRRNSDPPELFCTDRIIYHDEDTNYMLKSIPVKIIVSVKGISKDIHDYMFQQGRDYLLDGDSIRWKKEEAAAQLPDNGTEISINYIVYSMIRVPKGTEISTQKDTYGKTILFKSQEDGYLKKNTNGIFEALIIAEAVEPGRNGNVPSETIKVMLKPPEGVEEINNPNPMTEGSDTEPDDLLRDRTKHVLDLHGKATLESLKRAVTSVDGVESLLILDMPDSVPGEVRIIVEGGNFEDICKKVEDTRAAGIKVYVERPKSVVTNITADITIKKKTVTEHILSKSKTEVQILTNIEREVKYIIERFFSTMSIGTNIIVNKLISSILSHSDVVDVDDLKIEPISDEIISTRDMKTEFMPEKQDLPKDTKFRSIKVKSLAESAKEVTLSQNEIFRAGVINIKCKIID